MLHATTWQKHMLEDLSPIERWAEFWGNPDLTHDQASWLSRHMACEQEVAEFLKKNIESAGKTAAEIADLRFRMEGGA
jgi:NTP pyrophosphatase (non-canonical NTP hydrolase)